MRILVLGAGGMLGHRMYLSLRSEFPEVWAGVRKKADHYVGFSIFDKIRFVDEMDIFRSNDYFSKLDKAHPTVVINCIGLTTRKIKPGHEAELVQCNALFPYQLKDWCQANGARLIHFSTDCVFSGQKGSYTEESFLDAKDLYGKSKALGEVTGQGVLTLRSSIIGLELENKTELLEWFLSQREKTIKGYSRVMYSGVTTNHMARVVIKILKEHPTLDGLYQVASTPISKFDLLSIANRIFDNKCIIEKTEVPASDKTLSDQKFRSITGITTPSWEDQLKEISLEYSTSTQIKARVA